MYEENDHDFHLILGNDVSIAHSKHSGASEVDAVDVLGEGISFVLVDTFEPVLFLVNQRHRVDDNGLSVNRLTDTCRMMKSLLMKPKRLTEFLYL